VWSTIPMAPLIDVLDPAPPPEVRQAASGLRFRSMVLAYLTLGVGRFTSYDAHYFPGEEIPVARLSEPKNYSTSGPSGRTVLCAELPTSAGSDLWRAADASIQQTVLDSLAAAGLPVTVPVIDVTTRRLERAYPIYEAGFEDRVATVDRWLSAQERLVAFGRQALFAHNNLHHALEMAYSAVSSLGADGSFDRERWGEFRTAFDQQVVVD
jgi:protoporphyrinogen oxidase